MGFLDYLNDPPICLNWIPGMKSGQSFYLSELSGVDGFSNMLQIITTYFHITNRSVTMGLDCLPAINQAQSTDPL